MSGSFRDLVEKISHLSEKDGDYSCPLCDENPCVCDQDKTEDNLEETVSVQRLAKSFANTEELPYAVKVFLKLKSGGPEKLNNDERLEAAKILKMLLPTISEDDLFVRINNDMTAREKAGQAAQAAPAPGVTPEQNPGATAASHEEVPNA